jgi:hypothetical protein
MRSNKILAILPEDIEGGDVTFSETLNYPYLIIFLAKEENAVFLNKTDYATNTKEETIYRSPQGKYRLEIYSIKGNLLEAFNFNLSTNKYYEAIVIPNYLNIGEINLLVGNRTISSLKNLEICNENNICEAGEENLCPLDCPSANNPNYPLTVFEKEINVPYKKIEEKIKPQKEIKELQIVTQTPILPEKSFSYISLITAIVFVVFLIFGIIIYLKIKK